MRVLPNGRPGHRARRSDEGVARFWGEHRETSVTFRMDRGIPFHEKPVAIRNALIYRIATSMRESCIASSSLEGVGPEVGSAAMEPGTGSRFACLATVASRTRRSNGLVT